jgi:POT family proton-dependent oligopeptide transporter
MFNNLVSQAGQMDLHGVPNDMIQAFSGVACVLMGPLIQQLYNTLAAHRIAFGPIARIAVAFLFCAAAMAYAAGTQALIYRSAPCYDRPRNCPAATAAAAASPSSPGAEASDAAPNAISVWVQVPVYFVLAAGEILGFVTASEYAYSKAPANMKTVVQAFAQLTAGGASALAMALSPLARDPQVLIMYASLAGVMVLATGLFWWRFAKYDRVDGELDQMRFEDKGVGEREGQEGGKAVEKKEEHGGDEADCKDGVTVV